MYGSRNILYLPKKGVSMNRLTLLSAALIVSVLPSLVEAKSDEGKHHVRVIRQKDIPFIISCPGDYELGENVTHKGAGVAIMVTASNVKLNLGTSSIKLTSPTATGISVMNPGYILSEITIFSDSIENTSGGATSGAGIELFGVNKARIENVLLANNFINLDIQNCTDITVSGSQFLNGVTACAQVGGSTNVRFYNTVFNINDPNNTTGFGLYFTSFNGVPSQDCSVLACSFPNSGTTNLFAEFINGLLIEASTFSNTGDTNQSNLVQIGGAPVTAGPVNTANNVIIRSSTFTNSSVTNTFPEGLLLQNGQDALVESCSFFNNNTGRSPDSDLSGIHIGGSLDAGATITGVIVRNCVVQGPAIDGIYPDNGSSNLLIEYCLTTGAIKDGILLDATANSTVQFNTSNANGRNGIGLAQTSTGNIVLNNVVSNNGFGSVPAPNNTNDGIFIQGTNTLGFDPSTNNIVQGNTAFNNAKFGIEDQGITPTVGARFTNNRVLENVAFNNGTNYSPLITAVSSLGSPTFSAGANINAGTDIVAAAAKTTLSQVAKPAAVTVTPRVPAVVQPGVKLWNEKAPIKK
jgi:hypothetical protein